MLEPDSLGRRIGIFHARAKWRFEQHLGLDRQWFANDEIHGKRNYAKKENQQSPERPIIPRLRGSLLTINAPMIQSRITTNLTDPSLI
jgi:hypothetical protein